jgi:Neutral/alkaline non-lysosomal ceramidase.
MKFCIEKEIITPRELAFLSGFEVRTQKSTGVHDDIYAKVVLIQANKTVVTITLDLTAGDRSFVDGIKGEINKRFGIKEDEVLVNFSHTHSSIAVTGDDADKRQGVEMYYSISHVPKVCFFPNGDTDYSEDVAYYNYLKEKLLEMLQRCFDNLEEGEMYQGKGESFIGVNRRLQTPEGIEFAPDFNKDIDKDLFVFALFNASKQLKGIIFCYGCHPSGLGSDKLSADYPGSACRYLEEHYCDTVAVFLQGCAGDIKPKMSANDAKDGFRGYSFEDCMETGKKLAEDVISVVDGKELFKIEVNISTFLTETRLYAQISNIEDLERRKENGINGCDKWLMAESAQRRFTQIIDGIKSGKPKNSVPCYISVWNLGSDVKIIGIEGEVVSGLGTRIKKLINDGRTIVMGYTNGIQCYVNTPEVLKEGGYETDSFAELNLSGPLVPECEDIIIGRIFKSGCIRFTK